MIFISKSHAEQLEGEICCIFSSANCLADRCGLRRSKGAQTGSSRLQRREEGRETETIFLTALSPTFFNLVEQKKALVYAVDLQMLR